MANFEVLSLDPTTPQIRAPGAGDGYSVPRDMTFATGTTLNAPTTVVSVNTSTDALRITQVGAGNALLVEDSANPDASPTAITATGAVGIGTATPSTVLHVKGTVGGTDPTVVTGERVRIQSNDTTGRSAYMSLIAGTAANSGVLFGDQDAADVGQIRYLHSDNSMQFYTSSAERMRLDTSGNVGIGTTSPATNLSVVGTGITDASSNGAYQVTVDNNAAYNLTPQGGIIHRFKWSSAGTLTTGAGIRFYKPNTNDSDASSQIGFLVRSGIAAQSQAMTLDSSGNLLVGTTSSGQGRLMVKQAASSVAGGLAIQATSNDSYLGLWNDGSVFNIEAYYNSTGSYQPIAFRTSNTERARITAGGELCVGTTTANGRITVQTPGSASEFLLVGKQSSSTTNQGILFGAYESAGSALYGVSLNAITNYSGTLDATMAFYTTSSGTRAERARLTPNGYFGVGTSSPQAILDVSAPLSSNGPTIRLSSTGTTASSGQQIGAVDFYNSDADIPGVAAYVRALAGPTFGVGGELVFGTQSTWATGVLSERARIDSSGNLLVGTTNTSPSANVGAKIYPAGTMRCVNADSANTTENWSMYSTGAANYRFYVGWGGTVYATNTTISAISDQRYKENIRDLDVGLDAILALKPRKFDWKAGQGKDIKDDRGFIAQEFEQVFPDLVDEWKDPAPEGEEPYKSVRQDLIPVLVKAMQEQQAMIEELKAKVAALEAR